MPNASGIYLVKREKRNPIYTTTYGTGELIKYALDKGSQRLLIGIGGSATNNGGAGMAQALGVKFLDEEGKDLPFGVSTVAKKFNIPTIRFAGRIGEGTEVLYEHGITSIVGILSGTVSLEEALKDGTKNMERISENITRILKL